MVGCGTGREVILLSQRLDCNVDGIDVTGLFFESPPDQRVRLRVMDICKTDYDTGSFDFLYSFHTLEHIPDLDKALKEMRRLLRPTGVFCIGTPNKARLVGSISTREPLKVKIISISTTGRCGLQIDGTMLGAHAGFTRKSLQKICIDTFGEGSDITDEYYRRGYKSWSRTIEAIIRLRLANYVFPGVYMLGSRREN